MNEAENQGDIDTPQDAPAAEHHHHGHRGFAAAPENAGAAVGHGQQEVKQSIDSGVDDAVGNGLRVADKEPEQLGDEEVHEHTGDFRENHGGDDSEQRALFGPGDVSCPQILTDIGGKGHAHGRDGQKGEALNLGVGPLAAHGAGPEGIDVGLNDHVAQADDGVLNPGGQALADDSGRHLPVIPQRTEAQPQMFLRLPAHSCKAQHHAEPLGNHRGNGRAGDAPMEHRHKQQIQHHIGYGGDKEVVQGPDAVPLGLHNGHADIVEDNGDHAPEIHPEILQGVGEYILRRVHKDQEPWNQQKPHDGSENGGKQAKKEVRVDGLSGVFPIPGTEIPGDDHAAAYTDAAEKADNQKGQVAAAADGREGAVLGEVSNDPGIGHVVKLLQ